MEDSENFAAGSEQGNVSVTPPYPKHLLPKSGFQPVNMEFSPSLGGNDSVASMKEVRPGSSSSSSSSSKDSEQERKIVGEEETNDVSWESENSYNELLSEFLKKEEELKVKLSNIKLTLSEENIVKLNLQIEKSEGQLNNVLGELKVKEENLEYEKGQVLELQKKTADLETHVQDCSLKIAKLETQLELAEEQLKISNDEIARFKEELNSRSSGTRELLAQENVTTLESQLVLQRKQIHDLKGRATWYKANKTNIELEVKKLKTEMLDAQAQFSLEKDMFHFDMTCLSEENKQLGSRLEEYESRSNIIENKSRQLEAEKLKLEELLATQQMVLQGEINCLKEELDQRRHDFEALNEEFDRHKQKYDVLMTEKDEANAKIHNLMAETRKQDNRIACLERDIMLLRRQEAGLITGSAATMKFVKELKLKVDELGKEVTLQNAVISDRAEEKREAIRQLCFSIEHYRSGYKELLQAFAGHKRHAVTAA